MKKEYRIKKSSEIDAIFKKRQSKGNQYFAVYKLQSKDDKQFRFALSVGKKYGNAVERNLIKRRIRHIVQSLKEQFITMRFVVVIKPTAKSLSFKESKEKIYDLFKKLNLLETTHEKS